jgi:UDP-2,4-diacetamido-2,4,6-trideoxy-beta-L-altropyranose hydrolase/UDP-4-amino-4,6-dideoxy-N-acetyl-beta-L-altrosamine N-acetyltransferase
MKFFFRVDASLEIGSGHVIRCLTFAQILKENGADIEFICREHEGNLIDKISSNGFYVNRLKLFEDNNVETELAHSHWLGATQKQDVNDCIDIIKNNKVDWLIVDHYALDERWQKHLKPFYKKLMVIDDLADRKHCCDVLLDQTFGRQEQDYSNLTPKGCQLLLGSQYALLRPEFHNWRTLSLKRRKIPTFKQLLINMGGVDIHNFTEVILDEIRTASFLDDINITVVMGGNSPHLSSVKSKANKLIHNIKIEVDVDNMAEILANSDIAIGAAGSSTWERCCLGLPTIQLAIAENQKFLAKKLAQENIVKLIKTTKEISDLLESPLKWIKESSSLSSKICDGTGSYRVFNKMADKNIEVEGSSNVKLCNYVNLNEHDKRIALEMRNHPEIRMWMNNQDNISEEEHFEFINNLEIDIKRRYFLVKQKDNIIGSINFSEISHGESLEFGIYSNPLINLKGSGSLLELVASQYAFLELDVKKINLEVLRDNKRAINFYKKCGFIFLESQKNNQKNIMHMQKIRAI